jgi:hypothetical protein
MSSKASDKEEIQIATSQVKKYIIVLVVKERHSKITMKY